MNNITKYNLKTCVISALGVILLFGGLTYAMFPQTERFELSSINPFGFAEGFVFALGFGLGVPVWLAVVVVGLVSVFIFMVFLWITRKVIK